MNFKFVLTIALSFGCILILFMWYSANNIYKDSQLYEKQFLFKISTLESENKMELKLINSLRIEISKNDEDLKIKSNLLETLHNKEKSREDERKVLQKNIDDVKTRYDTVNKENNAWLDNWKLEFQNKSVSDKHKINQLNEELESLKIEYNRLKQLAAPVSKIQGKPAIDDHDQARQGKAPVRNNDKSNQNSESDFIDQMVKSINKTMSVSESKEVIKEHDLNIDKGPDGDESHKKLKAKDAEKMEGDNQLKKPHFEPVKAKADDDKDVKQFIQEKNDVHGKSDVKLLKRNMIHQVRPPVPAKKDKKDDVKAHDSVDHHEKSNKVDENVRM